MKRVALELDGSREFNCHLLQLVANLKRVALELDNPREFNYHLLQLVAI